MTINSAPFHPGELEAQRRAGAGDVVAWAGSFVRDHMSEEHRALFTALPFLVVAAGDRAGRPWVTIIEGPDGFVQTPDPRRLTIAAASPAQDPLAGALVAGAAVGMLGIDLATRRRNRMNGLVRAADAGFSVEVQQSFGNCPQYIREREWHRAAGDGAPTARISQELDARQRARIAAADTFFIGTGFQGKGRGQPSSGYDASHRGGAPGFVHLADDGTLRIPDYAGNNYFNTIGNLVRDPRVGLVFVEFETGDLLHITGRARIDWTPRESHDPNAHRMIEVTVEEVVDRPAALALRWCRDRADVQRLRVIDKVRESDRITSLLLASADGAALAPFAPGQHLPIELDIPGQPDRTARSYSLSGPRDNGTYRISIKREERGIASGFLHSSVDVGSTIDSRPPTGDFVVPKGRGPLVLVSAGVGVTPMLSILHAVAAESQVRPVWFVHVARDGRNHAFRREVEGLAAEHLGIVRKIFYTAPRDTDVEGIDFDVRGRVTAAHLTAEVAGEDTHYMLCGPAGFLADMKSGLERAGVAEDRVHFESFGPGG